MSGTPNVGYATLTVIPSFRGAEAVLNRQVGTAVAASGRKAGVDYGKSFGDSASKGLLSTQAKVAGLAAGGLLARSAIKQASDLTESLGKSQQVFGALTGQVERFGDSAAKNLGLSKQAAIESVATFGNLFTAMKIGQQPAADMSTTLVQLAGDLASFNNTSTEDAFVALRSGLVGEQEPLRRFGVNLNEATLKARALQLGLSDGKGVLGAAAKAQAAYSIILEQTATAQGDYARTADNLANRQRTASAEWKNAQAALGQGLLPTMTAATGLASDLAGAFGRQPQALIKTEVAALALGVSYVKLRGPITLAIAKFTELAAAETAAGTAAAGAGTAVAGAVAGITAFVGATAGLNKLADLQAEKVSVEGLAASFDLLASKGDVGGELADKFGADLGTLATRIKEIDGSTLEKAFSWKLPQARIEEIDQLDKALASLAATDPAAAAAIFGEISAALVKQGVNAEQVGRAFGDYMDAVDNAAVATQADTAAVDDNAAALRDWHVANKTILTDLTARIAKDKEMRDATNAAKSAIADIAEAEKAAAFASNDANDIRFNAYFASIENAKAVTAAEEGVAAAERGVAEAMRGVEAAQRGVTDAVRGQEAAQRGVQAAQRAYNDTQREAVRLQRDLTDAAEDYKTTLLDLQDAATASGFSVERALGRLQDAQDALTNGSFTGDDPTTTKNELRELQLAVEEAQLAYNQAKRDAADAATTLADAQTGGLDQFKPYQDAQIALVNNVLAQQNAAQALDDAKYASTAADQAVIDSQHNVQTAYQGVTDAQKAAQAASAELGAAHKKVTDDMVVAAFGLFAIQDQAKKQLPELRDAAVDAYGVAAVKANEWGLNLKGVHDWLGVITSDLAPGSEIRAYLDQVFNTGLTGSSAPQNGNASFTNAQADNLGLSAGAQAASDFINGGHELVPVRSPTGAIIGYTRKTGLTSGESGPSRGGVVVNNNITSTDPQAVAREVSRQVVRTGAP